MFDFRKSVWRIPFSIILTENENQLTGCFTDNQSADFHPFACIDIQHYTFSKIYHLFLCYKPGLYYCFFMGKEIVVENPLFNALEIDTVPL